MPRNAGNGKLETIVGVLLRQKRHALGLRQQDIWDAVNLRHETAVDPELEGARMKHRKTIGDLEAGFIHVKLTHLAEICPVLGIRISDLLREAEDILEKNQPIPEVKVREIWNAPTLSKAPPAITPSWLEGVIPHHLKEQHAASANELRRRNSQRDLEDSTELCEAHEG